jgi:hypothetical protein
LKLDLHRSFAPDGCILFQPDAVYPHLRVIACRASTSFAPLSEQQLGQLCSSCPALESLEFVLRANSSQDALQPLLQLPGLTALAVCVEGAVSAAAPAAAEVDTVAAVAGQLTQLKQLKLVNLP